VPNSPKLSVAAVGTQPRSVCDQMAMDLPLVTSALFLIVK
jgi:hypothetical protein